MNLFKECEEKMVTKACPNCGKELSFEESRYEIKCDYCQREFLIKKNIPNNKEIEYVLVKREVKKYVNVGPILVIIFLCIGLVIIALIFGFSILVRTEFISIPSKAFKCFSVAKISQTRISFLLFINCFNFGMASKILKSKIT